MDPYRRREVKLVIEIVSTAQLGLLGAREFGAAGRTPSMAWSVKARPASSTLQAAPSDGCFLPGQPSTLSMG